MSLFARHFYNQEPSFTPLFRLLDDFDNYSRDTQSPGRPGQGSRSLARTFNPRFDVKEKENSFELHGELPGVERENINLEFTDPQTLVISGRVERTYTAGTPPAGAIEGSTQASGAITESGEAGEVKPTNGATSHKVTVEDEKPENTQADAKPTEEKPTAENETEKAVEKTPAENETAVAPANADADPKEKYWVSERTVGEFSRVFSFPSRIDQEGVSASLKNGVLSVVAPKAKKYESRHITVN